MFSVNILKEKFVSWAGKNKNNRAYRKIKLIRGKIKQINE